MRVLGLSEPPPVAWASAIFADEVTFAFPPARTIYQTAYGFKLSTSATDMWQPLATGHYFTELVETGLLLRLAPSVECFVDVGANVGFYSLLMASEGLPVLACEPSSENLRALEEAIEANGFGDRIDVVEAAVGAERGTATLRLSALGSGGHSIVAEPNPRFRATEEVTVLTLDALCSRLPDAGRRTAVKIDVEGFEFEVLAGARGWTSGPDAPILLLEAWPAAQSPAGDNHVRLIETLTGLGYRVFAVSDDPRSEFALADVATRAAPPPQANYLALPSWAGDLSETLAPNVDVRAFVPTSRLTSIEGFLRRTIADIEQNLPPKC